MGGDAEQLGRLSLAWQKVVAAYYRIYSIGHLWLTA